MEDEALDDPRGDDTLLRVEVRARLVDEVDVGRLAKTQDDGDTLELSSGEGRDVLVHDDLELHRLDDVRVELRVHERRAHLLEEQLPDRSRELGRDRLGLKRDLERDLVLLLVGLDLSRKELDKGRLAGPVLAEHDDDLRVGEGALLDVELEVPERLGHRRVLVPAVLLLEELLCRVGDLEVERLLAKSEVLGRDPAVEEDVDSWRDTGR